MKTITNLGISEDIGLLFKRMCNLIVLNKLCEFHPKILGVQHQANKFEHTFFATFGSIVNFDEVMQGSSGRFHLSIGHEEILVMMLLTFHFRYGGKIGVATTCAPNGLGTLIRKLPLSSRDKCFLEIMFP